MKKIVSTSLALAVSSTLYAGEAEMQKQIDMLLKKIEQLEANQKLQVDLEKKVQKLEKKQKKAQANFNKVKAKTSGDNIKWSVDLRSAYDNLQYKYNSGDKISNPSIFTERLRLGMSSTPMKNLFFKGQLEVYKTFGGNKIPSSESFQNVDWRAASRPDDGTVRIKEAYFVYSPNKKVSFSVGRRPSTTGFLANWREGDKKPGSPLAHITNMEVDAGMMKINDLGLPGSYVKFVAGRAHDTVNQTYSQTPYIYNKDYAQGTDDGSVDFFVVPASIYDNGQHKLMTQYTAVFNSKGYNADLKKSKVAAGTTQLGALSYQIEGLSEDNEFLEDSIFFASVAGTFTVPKSSTYKMLGTSNAKFGYSFWTGFLFPDMISDGGKFGLEYNYGSKYWTPMTWAEDTLSGSKIATRGNVGEVYWNIPIVKKHLSAQIRYTYSNYNYTANTICYWETPTSTPTDLDNSQDLRIFIRYQY
jgi:regulator of replication initiation timing